MDWAKAKNIFILSLLLLNIFLLGSILLNSSNLNLRGDYKQYAQTFLNSRNITFESDIPTYSKDSGIVDYKYREINEEQLVIAYFGKMIISSSYDKDKKLWRSDGKVLEIGNNIIKLDLSLEEARSRYEKPQELVEALKQYIKKLGLVKNELMLESVQDVDATAKEILFIESYKGQLLFDNTVRIQVTNKGQINVEVIARDVEKIKAPDEILSAYQILVMANIPEGSVISAMDFGYKRVNSENLYDSPVWRIRYQDGSRTFFNAYTGDNLGK